MRSLATVLTAWFACLVGGSILLAAPQLAPHQPDDHTLLLYHFDEGQGASAGDVSGHGGDGEVRGAEWTEGRFGTALRFDGVDDCVFRQVTRNIEGLRQLTVECWFKQEQTEGRQFLLGKDVTFHCDFSDGSGTSLSLYNRGGVEANADGLPHQQLGLGLGLVRSGRWHHLATTYDGRQVSFFLDGVLRGRLPGARDFLLGAASRGLWIGCYVGQDFWFSGKIDEVRVSDCVRYDPENQLQVGQAAFEVPASPQRVRAVRNPQVTGRAQLNLTLRKLYGPQAVGFVSLKSPGKPVVIVGSYDLTGVPDQADTRLTWDVSDEMTGDGCFIVGLEETGSGGYFAVTEASLQTGDAVLATWTGQLASRRTFAPPILLPLRVGATPSDTPRRVVLLPEAADRWSGNLDISREAANEPASLFGEGQVEYWLEVPAQQTYRVYLRYATPVSSPCDLVIDGNDLHAFHMAARNRTGGATPYQAFWEYQGTVSLAPGLHWVRLQDVLPEIVALRFDPVADSARPRVPWQRDAVPAGDFLVQPSESWIPLDMFGQPRDAQVTGVVAENSHDLQFSVSFHNTNRQDLFGGDAVRLRLPGGWDLEPFGRLSFSFQGHASGHVVSLILIDLQGNEKLLWRHRDVRAERQEFQVPVLFEGNEVFDPGHVDALCVELDEGNTRVDKVNIFQGSFRDLVWERRDVIVPPEGYDAALRAARQQLADLPSDTARPAERLVAPRFQPWTSPVVPEDHPRFAQSDPQPVTRATLGYELHCTGARSIDAATLDNYHKFYDFGDVCWPHIGTCPQRKDYATDADYAAALVNMEKQFEEVRRRGLYVFDVWGYVPFDNNYPARIAPEHREILTRVLGDRFLGFDNGEQDGRYIGGFAANGRHTNRREGWDDFVRWDEQICRDNQNYMNATGSLNFSHYYGERNCRTLGLETAQGLPSDTLMFAFLRGASKEYGRLTTQATSVWNRFGYNMYNGRKTEGAGGYGLGPNKGCSLSLHRRLLLSSYLGGHSIVGSETSQFTADVLPSGAPELSPLGRQHVALNAWFRQHPERGVMFTPVACMLDFHHGWNMPRHLYRSDMYKIWGKFPYEKGDYAIDGLFRMIWPGYEDCSYLRNERGFLTPTPYGDIFDVVTNRCPPEVLRQYTAIMLLGDVEMTPALVQHLTDFVRNGGDILLDANQARALPEQASGMQFRDSRQGTITRSCTSGEVWEEQPYTYCQVEPVGATSLLTNELGHPLVTANRVERGRVVVCTVDHWMTDPLQYRVPEIVHMTPPFQMLRGLRAVLADYFASFSPVAVEPAGLGVTTCCYADDPQRLLVGLLNNDLFADWQGTLQVRHGAVTSVKDILNERELPAQNPLSLIVPAGDAVILDVRW
ncbi:MAG: LamG domain-containing protein [Pirellulaceae bacterium]